jgi:hypothetical protein
VSSTAFVLLAGVVYTLLGIVGLFPAALSNGYLMGLFPMNVPHSVVHLAIGIAGLAAAITERRARFYARAAAVLFAGLGLLGLLPRLSTLYGVIPLYGHAVWLHLGTAAIAAYFGWRADIPVLHQEEENERRQGAAERRETITTVSRERRRGAYDRRTPLGA